VISITNIIELPCYHVIFTISASFVENILKKPLIIFSETEKTVFQKIFDAFRVPNQFCRAFQFAGFYVNPFINKI